MYTAGFKCSWRKTESGAEDRAGRRRVVCGLFFIDRNNTKVSQENKNHHIHSDYHYVITGKPHTHTPDKLLRIDFSFSRYQSGPPIPEAQKHTSHLKQYWVILAEVWQKIVYSTVIETSLSALNDVRYSMPPCPNAEYRIKPDIHGMLKLVSSNW